MRISVFVSPELRLLTLRLRDVEAETRKQIRRLTKTYAQPMWQRAVAEHVTGKAEAIAFGRTARVAVSDRNVTLQAAKIGKPLSGGLNPKTEYHALEFGSESLDDFRTYEGRSSKGKPYSVKRRTSRQLPRRNSSGRVVYPAAATAIPELASLWWSTAKRALGEALDGKGSS